MTGSVLVTGASGALGPIVVRSFREAGYRTRALCLDAPREGTLPSDCEVLAGDICDRQLVGRAVKGVDAVVHMAALLHVESPPLSLVPEYERVNVEGTRILAEAVTAEGVARLVYFSTISVYGPGEGRLLDESSAPRPVTPYASSKLVGEGIVLEARKQDGAPASVVLRLAAAYGSRVKGNYARLVRSLVRGRFVPVGAGHNRRTVVHEEDIAAAVLLAARHPGAPGGVFNLTDGDVHTVAEIIQAICDALERQPPRVRLPEGLVRAACGPVETVARKLGVRPPVTRAMLKTYLEDVTVAGDLIQKRLGFQRRWNLTTGWAKTINEMRCARLLS